MDILKAIARAKAGYVVRRESWPAGVEIFTRDEGGDLYWNNPPKDIWEKPLWAFTPAAVLATDWVVL